MALLRRTTSKAQSKLQARINALSEVENDFDLGDNLDMATLTSLVEDIRQKRDKYNNTLANADTLRDELDTLEKKADDVAERLYAAVIARYGRDSAQYQQIGGVRKSKIDYSGSRPATYSNGTENPEEEEPTDSGADNGE